MRKIREHQSIVSLDPLKKMVECALISPYIKDEKPISLLIAAVPESGKSTVMKQYNKTRGVLYLTDCTAYGIQQNYLPSIVSGETKTIMISDLITPISKATKTRKSFIAFLNNLTEEGVGKIATYAHVRRSGEDARANVITAITRGCLGDARHGWDKMGFLSRFIVFSYSYSNDSVNSIMSRYSEQGLAEKSKKIKLKLPRRSMKVELPFEIADRIDPIAKTVGSDYNLYGFRAKINFRCLLKCLSSRNKRKTVTEADFQEFLELTRFLNFEYNPI